MKYTDFEQVMSAPRMARYVAACGGSTKKAMTLYRLNLRLSQELFTIISCFEIAFRNAIDNHYIHQHGNDWLRNTFAPGGIFNTPSCQRTASVIRVGYNRISSHYTHSKLVAEMDFGLWRYLFAQPQFYAGGQTLLQIFPARPRSTPAIQYNHTYVFNELAKINDIRNRIAHHEPICFQANHSLIDSTNVRQHYVLILQLFQWMSIDEGALLYGLDHINTVCNQIDTI
ncbi:Abi family protein [Spirosoma endophyticum]|uniref:Abi-like protein n=1 Tax=Spirosoma endophyticum TaxID=662367 RepID=A0A1I2GNF8_9BACT|nr:Abi family protein [Spirosoma endophyticum]SFF18773.1 Abi-like protein [Spirosoma endophyticum]